MDLETEKMFISVVTEATFLASSKDWNVEVASLFTQLVSVVVIDGVSDWSKIKRVIKKIYSLNQKMEFLSLTDQVYNLMRFGDLDSEWKVVVSLVTKIIFLVSSMDLDSDSNLISCIKKIISLFNSKPDSELEIVSLVMRTLRFGFSTKEHELMSLIVQLVSLKKTELESLTRQIITRFKTMNWEPLHVVSFCPQAEVRLEQGKFRVLMTEDVQPRETKKGHCRFDSVRFKRTTTENYFYCGDCNGKNHEEYDKVLVEVKHPLHPKHSLQPVLLNEQSLTRECYCCDKDMEKMFYYCSACDYAMNLECLKKPPPVLSIDHPKWHEHQLALFPSQAPLTCNLCAITHSGCPFYICPPCDFVVHQKCLTLPRVIRISRHLHRISFTACFDKGNKSCCGVCRKKIYNDYGGYSCIKDGCSYVAHSRCATQTNVWDGKELEGVPEETEEEEVLEPFVRISDGVIQHFSHQQHYLKLDENADRDYDENKLCQACITPIYFGNFYSCMECEFILHEKCANFPRRIFYPMHPHQLTLVCGYEGIAEYLGGYCSACYSRCIDGFFYQCGKRECHHLGFKIHVQCATNSEPLVHESHLHPLYLTSKPEETRECSVCDVKKETFNCIEGECDFSLCFRCATTPQKVRYKHDKHVLSLTYGEETSTMTYWCEVCEEKVNPKERFYTCDEYCCVTLHIECLIGNELYMKAGSSFLFRNRKVCVLPNNQHMSRPFCSYCKKRSPFKLVIQYSDLIFCSMECVMLY